jgi:hypothetical protein
LKPAPLNGASVITPSPSAMPITSPAHTRSPRGLTAVPMIAHTRTKVPMTSHSRPSSALPWRSRSDTAVAPYPVARPGSSSSSLTTSAATTPPISWTSQYTAASNSEILRRVSSPKVTAGLKWAPDVPPSV